MVGGALTRERIPEEKNSREKAREKAGATRKQIRSSETSRADEEFYDQRVQQRDSGRRELGGGESLQHGRERSQGVAADGSK